MTQHLFWYVDTGVTGYNGGELRDGAPQPGVVIEAGGWVVGTNPANRFGIQEYSGGCPAGDFAGTTRLTNPPVNTPNKADCFRSANALTTTFDAGTWQWSMSVASAAAADGQRGHFQIKVWKSSNADGSSATELTSGVPIAGLECPAINGTFTRYAGADISWAAPEISLSAEYLFVQHEWVTDVAGTNSSDDVRLWIHNCSILTPAPFLRLRGKSAGLNHMLRR